MRRYNNRVAVGEGNSFSFDFHFERFPNLLRDERAEERIERLDCDVSGLRSGRSA